MEMKKAFKLNNGATMPAIGLGTWKSQPGEVAAAVKAAIRCGYRHIDCARMYLNEPEVGQALTEVLKELGLKREDIFVTSKLWCNDHDDVLNACQKTLKSLQLDYLDLYLIHHPYAFAKDLLIPTEPSQRKGILGYDKQRMSQTWKAMEELVHKGLCKTIGVSNFSITRIKHLLETAGIVPATNQVELHPLLPQPGLKKFCEEKGILLSAYSPLGSPDRPTAEDGDPVLLEEPLVKELAKKRNCTPAQLLLAWGIYYGVPVLPKSVNEDRIEQNLQSFNVKLNDEDMKALEKIGKKFRYLKMEIFWKGFETFEQYWDEEQEN